MPGKSIRLDTNRKLGRRRQFSSHASLLWALITHQQYLHTSISYIKMSVTTTDNPITTTLHRAAQPSPLQDYEVLLTNSETTPGAAPPNRTPSRAAASNPPGWGTEHRGVPPYRPINTELDLSQRPWNGTPVGDAFVFTMFTGVFTVAVWFISVDNPNETNNVETEPELDLEENWGQNK